EALYTMDRFGKNRKRIKGGVSSAPQFSPDGKKILYSRKHKVDRYGSTQNDVFVYDLETEKEEQLTKSARIADVSFSPDGKTIVGVRNADGTHHLVVMDSDGENERVLAEGPMGTQFYSPHYSPDGERILFGIFDTGTRDVAVISSDGTGFHYVLQTPNDERNARWNEDGTGILLASDRTGIFNVYEIDLENGTVAQLTNVLGGAFMPDDSPGDGAIVYSHYSGNGYSVYLLDGGSDPAATMDLATFVTRDAGEFDECTKLKSAPAAAADVDVLQEAKTAGNPAAPEKPSTRLENGAASPEELPIKPPYPKESFETSKYKSRYSIFQFFPRIVVWDSKLRLGLFMASNEILDKQSLFVGGALGTNKEYDAYVSYEIRNFYPTLFADFVVLRELHADRSYDEETGSEFIYDTTYDLWQSDIGLKFDLSDPYSQTFQNQLAAYWSHGEYRVHLEGDEIRYGEYFGSFKGGWKYYVGNEGIFRWTLLSINPAVDSDINPRGGRQVSIQYLRSWNQLFTSGEFEYGFKPILTDSPYNQFTVDWREYIGLPFARNSLRLRLYGSVIDRNVDDFFWIYVGGRDFNRGYSYYSIGGRKAALASLTYRFPVWRNINKQLLNIYFRDFFVGLFYETSNAWTERGFATDGWKNSVGIDLRLSLGSYYMFPTAISITSAYALDPVENVLLGFGQLPLVIRQERGWRFYTTVGFGFDL
ncbi:MAG: DPP IV N-terminal domain-containing protein, partial [bacterium]